MLPESVPEAGLIVVQLDDDEDAVLQEYEASNPVPETDPSDEKSMITARPLPV